MGLSSFLSTIEPNEVYLGGVRLPVRGRLQLVKATQHPGKISIGVITRADQVLADEWIQYDWRVGNLIWFLDETLHQGRFFWSTVDTRIYKRLMLLPFATNIGNPTSVACDWLGSFDGNLWASFGGKMYKWLTNESWSTLQHDIGAPVKSAVTFNSKLWLATGGAYWCYDPGLNTWTSYNSVLPQYFVTFDANPTMKILEIDNTGLIQASTDGVTWVPDIGGQVLDVVPSGLINYRNASDEPAVFVATDHGLYVTDVWTKTIYPTDLRVLPNVNNGIDAGVWTGGDGDLYFPAGLTLWKYPKAGDIVNIGMDRDEGLPTFIRGKISHLVTNHPTNLIAVVDATKQTGTTTQATDPLIPAPGWYTVEIDTTASSGFSAIMAWNGQGWHTLYVTDSSGTGIPSICLDTSNNNNQRRLYFCDQTNVKWLNLPEGNYIPQFDPLATFQPNGTFQSSFFDGGYTEIVKLALSLKVRALNITATETIDVYYAINDATDYTYLGTVNNQTVDPGGRAIFFFNPPTEADPSGGIQFYNIRFQFVMNRDPNDNTKSPVLLFFDLRFKRLPAVLWGWTFTVVGSDPVHLQDIWNTIKAMSEARHTYQFAFERDARTYQPVEIVGLTGIQFAGANDDTSYFTVTIIELEKDTEIDTLV